MTLACGPDNRDVDDDTGWQTRINSRGECEWHPHPTSTTANPASTTTTAPKHSCDHPKTQKPKGNARTETTKPKRHNDNDANP